MIHPVEVGTLNLTDLRKIGMRDREGAILELIGKPGVYSYGVIVPGFWFSISQPITIDDLSISSSD